MELSILIPLLVQGVLVGIHVQPLVNISLCNLVTGYGLEHIGFTSSFNVKSTGSIFRVPSIPLHSSSIFCNNLGNSLTLNMKNGRAIFFQIEDLDA